ncbi:MAG: hypothetical protein JSV38_07055, partial [Desulfobacterales bacterium]
VATAPEPETATPEVAAVSEKPITQEPIKEATETPEPVAEQAPAPDTTQPEAEPEEKDLTVAAVTEKPAPVPAVVIPLAAEEAAPETETPITASTEETIRPEDHTDRLKAFLASYCKTYETKDLDRFFTLFAPDATENDTPFNDLRPKYKKNMEIIESFQYRIDMTDHYSVPDTGNTLVQGNFYIRYRLQGGTWKENSGNVTLELTEKGDSYLVKRLNYGN